MGRRPLCLLVGAFALALSGSATAEIRLGFASPLTGPYAASGARSRIAVELAVADLNRHGGLLGQPVTLEVADDACGLQQAIEAAHHLVAAKVRAVIGHLCSHSSLLAAGIYETADVLMITPASTHPRLTEEGRQNVFRLKGRDDQQGALAADLLAGHWPGAAIAVLHDGSVYGEDLAMQVRGQLRAAGVVEAIYDIYTPGADDYSALAAHLQAARIEVLYLGGYGPDAARILRALRARGADLQLVGGDGLGMDEFWTIAGKDGEGTVFSTRPNAESVPAAADLLARFRARGLGTRSGGLGSYAAVQVWAQAVERAGTLELPAVAGMLRRGRFDTVLGRVAFDQKGDLKGATWQWQVWQDGNYRPLSDPERDARAPAPDGKGGRPASTLVATGAPRRP
jgi:branched-chain amino acid transport system substrate-binding protein